MQPRAHVGEMRIAIGRLDLALRRLEIVAQIEVVVEVAGAFRKHRPEQVEVRFEALGAAPPDVPRDSAADSRPSCAASSRGSARSRRARRRACAAARLRTSVTSSRARGRISSASSSGDTPAVTSTPSRISGVPPTTDPEPPATTRGPVTGFHGANAFVTPSSAASQLRIVALQHGQHRVLLDVVEAELRVDLRAVVVGEEPIALQAPRRHQDEDAERRVAEAEALAAAARRRGRSSDRPARGRCCRPP